MVEEAQEFQEQDQKERERVESRNTLENFIFQSKSSLNGSDNGGGSLSDQLTDDERDDIEKALQDANEWLDINQDAEKSDLDDKLTELREHLQPLFTKAHQRAGIRDPGGFGGAGSDSYDLDGHD